MDLPKVIVITATIGTKYLKQCIDSVQQQTYPNIQHIIVCDGSNYYDKVSSIVKKVVKPIKDVTMMTIPWNSGANKFVCNKIYASIPHLIHEPCYISFLDEDNFYDPNHIESMVHTILKNKCLWTYSLRKIVSPNGEFICKDMCESLGKLSYTWISKNHAPDFLVDTSCYMVPVNIIRQFSECWQRPARSTPEGDRLFYEKLSSIYNSFECTMKYTLNYRVEGRDDSVKPDFFIYGNGIMKNILNVDRLPWDKD